MYEMWIIICINRTHTVDIYDFMHIFMVKHAIFYRYIFGTHDQTLIGDYLLLLCPCPYAIWGTLECVTYNIPFAQFYLFAHSNGEFKSRQMAIKQKNWIPKLRKSSWSTWAIHNNSTVYWYYENILSVNDGKCYKNH